MRKKGAEDKKLRQSRWIRELKEEEEEDVRTVVGDWIGLVWFGLGWFWDGLSGPKFFEAGESDSGRTLNGWAGERAWVRGL